MRRLPSLKAYLLRGTSEFEEAYLGRLVGKIWAIELVKVKKGSLRRALFFCQHLSLGSPQSQARQGSAPRGRGGTVHVVRYADL